ncbi:MAG: hypothetical protein E5V89_33110, partial [Mesorhizobium sp.]
GFHWHPAIETQAVDLARPVPGRSVNFMTEHRTEKWEPVFGQSDAKSNDHSRRASKARAGKGS